MAITLAPADRRHGGETPLPPPRRRSQASAMQLPATPGRICRYSSPHTPASASTVAAPTEPAAAIAAAALDAAALDAAALTTATATAAARPAAAVAAVAVAPTAQRRRSHPLTASSWGCARAGRPRRAASAREGGMCVAPLSGRGGRARGMRALTSKCYIVRAVCRSAHCTVPRCQWGVNVNTDPHTLRVGQPCGCLCVSLGQ